MRLADATADGWVYGDPHAHSRWSDGLQSARAQAEWAVRHGHGYLMLADHSDALSAKWVNYVDECERLSRELGLIVIPGTEVTATAPTGIVDPKTFGDCVVYRWPRGTEPPRNQYHSHASLIDLVEESGNGAFAFVAHPAARQKGWRDWERIPSGVEVIANAWRASDYAIESWFSLLVRAQRDEVRPLPVAFGGTDAHFPVLRPGVRGGTWIRSGERRDGDSMLESLRTGRAVASGLGDLAWVASGRHGPGDCVPSGSPVSLRIGERRGRRCTLAAVISPSYGTVASLSDPSDGQSVKLPRGFTGLLVGKFLFEGGYAPASECWSNPLCIDEPADSSD